MRIKTSMEKNLSSSKGLVACEEALQRLIENRPHVAEHVGLKLSKITAGVVSVEAGFDRGYLKKSRKQHLPILAKINDCRIASHDTARQYADGTARSLREKLAKSEIDLSTVRRQLDQVLAQNLQLWERIRTLELMEATSKNIRFHSNI